MHGRYRGAGTSTTGHQLTGHVCHTCRLTLKHVEHRVTHGHSLLCRWSLVASHPERQATALKPCPPPSPGSPIRARTPGSPNCPPRFQGPGLTGRLLDKLQGAVLTQSFFFIFLEREKEKQRGRDRETSMCE